MEKKKTIEVPIVFIVLVFSVIMSIIYNRQISKQLDYIIEILQETDSNVVNMNFGPGPDKFENSTFKIIFTPNEGN